MLLRSMRNGFWSALFLALLVLGAASLVLSDHTGTLQSGITKTDVANVDGTNININTFNTQVTRILKQQNIDPTTAYQAGLINNILENEIYDILVMKDAEKMGIKVSDKVIANQIKDLIAPLKNDKVSDREALKNFLQMQGLTEKHLTSTLRQDLTGRILKATIASATYIPQDFAKDLQMFEGATRDIDYVFYANKDVSGIKTPDDTALQNYYNTISSQYMTPEKRDITVAILDTKNIKKPVVTDEDIQSVYDDNKENYKQPETALVEQALFDKEDEAKKLVAEIKSGAAMKEAVQKVTGNTKAYSKENSFTKDGLPADIGEKVFAAKAGDVIGPVKSPLGFHVLKLNALKEPSYKSYDSVKDALRKELENEKWGDAVYNNISAIEDKIAGGETLENLGKEYPVTTTTLKNISVTTEHDKANPWTTEDWAKMLAKISKLKDKETSEFVDMGDNKLFSVRLDKLTPAAAKPFNDVRESILKRWMENKQNQENIIKVQKIIADLDANKTKWSDLKSEHISGFTKKGNNAIAADATKGITSAKIGANTMVRAESKDGIYLIRVNSEKLNAPSADDKTTKATTDKIQSDISNATYMSYMLLLQKKYPVTINDALLERAYGKKADAE